MMITSERKIHYLQGLRYRCLARMKHSATGKEYKAYLILQMQLLSCAIELYKSMRQKSEHSVYDNMNRVGHFMIQNAIVYPTHSGSGDCWRLVALLMGLEADPVQESLVRDFTLLAANGHHSLSQYRVLMEVSKSRISLSERPKKILQKRKAT